MNRHKIVNQLYRSWKLRPFDYGTADCLWWCSAVTHAITGHDPARDLKRRYTSKIGAFRVMRNEGWEDMGDVAASLLPEIPVSEAVVGDWAHVVDEHGNEGLGIVNGHMIAVRAEAGMGLVPLLWAKRAFRIG